MLKEQDPLIDLIRHLIISSASSIFPSNNMVSPSHSSILAPYLCNCNFSIISSPVHNNNNTTEDVVLSSITINKIDTTSSISYGKNYRIHEVFKLIEDLIIQTSSGKSSSHTINVSSCLHLQNFQQSYPAFFLPLNLIEAVKEYDKKTHFLRRRFVPPTFKEIRHILNLATIRAITDDLKLVTFDADDTIYDDGGCIGPGSKMVMIITELLKKGLVVSLVTAAGYPNEPEKYEHRLTGILEGIAGLPASARERFMVMGGECNYLHETYLDTNLNKLRLRIVQPEKWKEGRGVRWNENDIEKLLHIAQDTLQKMIDLFQLNAKILRKERACGIINAGSKKFSYQILEEIALTVQHMLKDCIVQHCAFNGGNDVWVDVGNKALGISALQKYTATRFFHEKMTTISGDKCLHVGDRFTRTGNDTRARDVSTTVWVSDPEETVHIMKKLIAGLTQSHKV